MIATYRYIKKRQQQKQGEKPQTPPCQHGVVGKCETCTSEKSRARKYRWKILFCLMPSFFLASLDLTIVATALPFMASYFDRLNQLNWIVTAFTLTSAAFIPAFGQLADVFGRHASLQFAVSFMVVGSTLCAAAQNWPMLLLGRALQGISTAGIQNITLIILADSVSLKEQAVNTSIFQLMNGIGYSVGPVIGGYITNANWRYCFVLAVGMSVISIPCIWFLRNDLKPGKSAFLPGILTLDFGGMILFILGTGLIILGTAWGGSTYPWNSAAVIASLVIGSVLFVGFFFYEYLRRNHNPMIPYEVLRHKDVGLVSFIAAATGAALYSVFYFIGIYFTLVEAYPASKAGVQLLYYVPGLGAGVYAAIFLCNVWPRQTFWPLSVGTIIETVGIAVLTYAVSARHATLVNVMMVVAGAGTGMRFMPSNLHLAGMFSDQIASVYSILRFALPFGGTLALTIMGSVFQNKMSAFLGSNNVNPGASNNDAALQSIADLPEAQQLLIRDTGANATMWAFVSILPILGLSMIVSFLLGNVWIAPRKNTTENVEAPETETSATSQRQQTSRGQAIDSIYLVELITGNVQMKKRQFHTHQMEERIEEKSTAGDV